MELAPLSSEAEGTAWLSPASSRRGWRDGGTSQNPASSLRGFRFNALNLFHLLTSSFRGESQNIQMEGLMMGCCFFVVDWVCRGVKVVV